MTKKKLKPISIGDDYVKIQKRISRELELERNGGRWKATTVAWKNKKHYDRKRDRIVDLSCFFGYTCVFSHVFSQK